MGERNERDTLEMKVNLHTHTFRCYHAEGTDEEYVLAAMEAGFDKLGFSDHTPFPYTDGFFNGDKMEMDQLEGYLSSVESLRCKYADKIEVLLGLECEAVEEFFPFLQEMRKRVDYLILGNHGDKRIEGFFGRLKSREQLWHYLECAVKGMETGLFLYLAHPDLMFHHYPQFDEDARQVSTVLCREAKRLNVPLEYNLYGIAKGAPIGRLGYPCPDFWKIAAQEGVKAVIGVDAHAPYRLLEADLEKAKQVLTELGIELIEDPTQPQGCVASPV